MLSGGLFSSSLGQTLFVALMGLYWIAMVGSLGMWVARDAQARGSDQPFVWALASVFTPIGLPYYLYRRYRRAGIGDRKSQSTTDRLLAMWASASLGAFLISSIFAPPDPLSQIWYMLGSFTVLLPSAYVLVYRSGYRQIREQTGS